MILGYVKAFLIGAVLCMIGQVLIDKTKLTPARILTLYVVAGVVLGAVGIYGPFAKWAGAGATVPLTGFGNLLAKGVHDAVAERAYSARLQAASRLVPPASARPFSLACSWRCVLSPKTSNKKRTDPKIGSFSYVSYAV